jgi:hypothetical protein
MTEKDWNDLEQDIRFNWNKDSYFTELKENEIMREKVDMMNIMANYVGQFYSAKWIRKNILKQTEDEIAEINKQIQEEQASMMQQQLMQQQMNPEQGQEQQNGQ